LTTYIEKTDLKELKLILKHLWLNIQTLNENNKENKAYMDSSSFQALCPLLHKVLELVKLTKNESVKAI